MRNAVLFLDLDGVLTHASLHAAWVATGAPVPPAENLAAWLDPRCLGIVDDVCALSGARIVLTSSRRTGAGGVAALCEVLKSAGLRAEILDGTPDLSVQSGLLYVATTRWQEIEAWLLAHPDVTAWAVVDDLDIGIPPVYSDRFVRIWDDGGLRTTHGAALTAALGGPLPYSLFITEYRDGRRVSDSFLAVDLTHGEAMLAALQFASPAPHEGPDHFVTVLPTSDVFGVRINVGCTEDGSLYALRGERRFTQDEAEATSREVMQELASVQELRGLVTWGMERSREAYGHAHGWEILAEVGRGWCGVVRASSGAVMFETEWMVSERRVIGALLQWIAQPWTARGTMEQSL